MVEREEERDMKYDLIIRGGTIVDGTGAKAFEGDLAVDGDRIAAVGQVDGSANREIDARDKLVTPGFVDIHTHLDAQIAWDPIASSSCYHGITSAVLCKCFRSRFSYISSRFSATSTTSFGAS